MQEELSQNPGRILALDLGRRRIGLAISDELGITAQGLDTLERTRIRDDLDRLAGIASGRGVTLILIGEPLELGGRAGRQVEYTREFGLRLERRTGLPVRYWDERLTTVEANRILRECGAGTGERARSVDRVAAVLLLQSYLEAIRAHRLE